MNRAAGVDAAARQFEISGKYASAAPYGTGHINDSYCAVFHEGDKTSRFMIQRINANVFRNPVAVMENIRRVTTHLGKRVGGQADHDRRVLTLIPARDGRVWHTDRDGNYWRAYRFIENARSYDAVDSPEQAFQAARAFGQFQQMLSNFPAPRLLDTIPDFHNTPKRFAALEQAIEADVALRAMTVKPEIEFALARKTIAPRLLAARLPERVTHNDTKFNNVLLDDNTGEGICVIDLDTVMPGLAAYDFGDMVRTTTSPAMEDEQDLSRVTMQFPMFEALVRGYLESARGFLTREEKQHLAFAGKLITFEIGVRFLTDYLSGDTYFKVHRDGHNLDRCRTQFKLVESIERQEEAMHRLVEELAD
jgi:hypothetical protein